MPICSYSPLLSASLVLLFILVKLWRKYNTSATLNKLPPGPPRLPFLGNLHQLIGPSPHHVIISNLAKKYGPNVMHLRLGAMSAVVISSLEAAKEVLKTKDINFSQRPIIFTAQVTAFDHSIFFSPYGDYWRQVRKICVLDLLSTKRVQSFRSIREEEIWNFISSVSLSEGVAINASERISYLNSNIIFRAAFSKKCKDPGEFLSLLAEMMRVAGSFNLPDLYPSLRFLRYFSTVKPALQRLHKKVDKILYGIINERKLERKIATCDDGEDSEDVLDVLLKLQEYNHLGVPISDKCVRTIIMEIFSAGSETSVSALEWAMAELIKNPRVMEKTQIEVRQAFRGKTKIQETDIQNLDYLTSVIMETLRLHPPLPLQPREARENCEINGYKVLAKEKILINAYAIGRDPNNWTEPESFRPERFLHAQVDFKGTNFKLIPFGGGRRICPGILFATASIELTLAQLLYHFDWKLPDGMKPEELDMSEIFEVSAKRKHNLHLIPTICVPFAAS